LEYVLVFKNASSACQVGDVAKDIPLWVGPFGRCVGASWKKKIMAQAPSAPKTIPP